MTRDELEREEEELVKLAILSADEEERERTVIRRDVKPSKFWKLLFILAMLFLAWLIVRHDYDSTLCSLAF